MQQLFEIYGMTLYNVSEGRGVVEKVQQDLLRLHQALRCYPALTAYLGNPTFSQKVKKGIFHALEGYLTTTTYHWLLLIVEKKRAKELEQIIAAAIGHFQKAQGREEVHVTTARPLNGNNRVTIERIVGELLPNKEVSLEVHIDETIVGGYILDVGDRRLDASLKRQLQSLGESWQKETKASKGNPS